MNISLHHDDLPENISFGDSVAIDSEAMGLEIKRDKLCLVQLSQGDGTVHLVKFDITKTYNSPNLVKLLEDENIQKIFHFARFDVAILGYYLNCKINNIYCTKIASKFARTYTDFHGLKDICRELAGKALSKQQQSSNWGAEVLSSAQLKYAAEDVLHLHKIRDKLIQMLEISGRTELVKKCFDFLPTRVEIDLAGWPSLDIFKH
jgi:ribonuclease D